MKEQVAVYEDMLNVKDEIIVKLTHEISDVEHQSNENFDQSDLTQSHGSRDSVLSARSDRSLPPIDEREYEKLKVSAMSCVISLGAGLDGSVGCESYW